MIVLLDGSIDELHRYVRHLADVMGLRDWVIDVQERYIPSDEGDSSSVALAQIDCAFGSRRAVISLDPGWKDGNPERLRMVIVHELTHAHLSLMGWIANNVHSALGDVAFGVFRDSMHDAEELAVDAIAMAWSVSLLLPFTSD